MYVVVAFGVTDEEPLPIETGPMPWLIEALIALIVVHERVEEIPVVIDVGFALRVQEGAGIGLTIRLTVAWLWKPGRVLLVPVKVILL